MQRIRIIISGEVTSVFFRKFIKENAVSLKINGWVRNIKYKVEAVFEGERKQINEILEKCKKGPYSSRVDKIEVIEEKPENLKGFKIIY